MNLPVYSGKQIVKGDFRIFSSNKSFLFKNRIMEVSVNHLLLHIESKSLRDSCIRFWKEEKFVERELILSHIDISCTIASNGVIKVDQLLFKAIQIYKINLDF